MAPPQRRFEHSVTEYVSRSLATLLHADSAIVVSHVFSAARQASEI